MSQSKKSALRAQGVEISPKTVQFHTSDKVGTVARWLEKWTEEEKKKRQEKAERSWARFTKRLQTNRKKTNFRKAHESILTPNELKQYQDDNWALLAQKMLFELYIEKIRKILLDYGNKIHQFEGLEQCSPPVNGPSDAS
jgi:hypothetical protein